ncbi:MAG TPA: hopanoid biosynthesis-associated protein HpnK [Armatimonadota bacterium]|jgi:hopanoid biosynthesis associated protein HpnK
MPGHDEGPCGRAACGKPLRRLIVNADDLGRSVSINRAVLRCHREGILTSSSLMVGGGAFAEAVALAKDTPSLGVGLHLTALCGHPVLAEEAWPRLVVRSGRFSDHPVVVGALYNFLPRARRLLAQEVSAQFERFARTGLPLSHVDGHLHFHVHPVIFGVALRLAVSQGAVGLRIPRDDLRLNLRLDPTGTGPKRALAAVFSAMNRRCLRLARRTPLLIPDRSLGLFRSERMDEGHLCGLVRHLPIGLSEIYLHPDDGGRGETGSTEMEALLSPRVRQAIEESGITLTSYSRG